MLKPWQVAALALLGAAMWGFVTFNIHAHPEAAFAPGKGLRLLVTAPIAGAVSVWLCKLAGRLKPDQLVPGVALVGAVAMLMDGIALRWSPALYSPDDKVLALTGADLLWGYGAGLLAALVWAWAAAAWARRAPAPGR
jgi:hypothetical protein